jgi:uncharacterized repeat protein (TIGR03803 family)
MAGPKYKVLHAFGFGKDAGGLLSNLTFDKKRNLYGTTSGGGAHKEGTVFELSPSAGGSWKEKVLHSFYYRNDGNFPYGGLIFDEQGNLYGTLSTGGPHQAGTVFKLAPTSNGWTETLLHSFCSAQRCTDGSGSFSGLILDPAGDLYGATFGGGRYGDGVLFELSPGSHGWTESVLYNFCAQFHCADGDGPYAGLIWDAAGNLYGTTEYGGKGSPQWGTAFELKHNPDGTWQHILLHSFPSFPGDGEVVYAGLVFDTSGNLYGATNSGGGHLCGQTSTCGTVFKLSRNANGLWKETILYRFPDPYNGNSPGASLVFDKAGNLYGTAALGGNNACANGCGVVFKLTPGSNGTWKYSVLHRFTGSDGANPAAALILDQKGNLYGTTTLGGPGGYGVVFEITP